MSKEFIEELRNHAAARTGYTTELIGKAADAIESQAATIARYEVTAENCDLLRGQVELQAREIERLRMRLVACGVVALANTPESAAKARDMHPDYMSASCGDVIRTVDIQMQLRAELAALKAKPSGVVLPARASTLTGNELDTQLAEAYNDALDEVTRLNQPASGGDPCMCGGNPHTTQCLYEHFLSYSGLADQATLRYAYFHGADEHCDQSASAGDERGHDTKGSRKALGAMNAKLRAKVGRLERELATLSANHSEQVREMVPAWNLAADELPASGKTVLAFYLNSHGMGRRIRAMHVKRFTVEAEEFADPETQCCEYSEQDDCYYTAEGWYELIDNWPDYSSCAVIEGVVTHWMPLPSAPSAGSQEQGE